MRELDPNWDAKKNDKAKESKAKAKQEHNDEIATLNAMIAVAKKQNADLAAAHAKDKAVSAAMLNKLQTENGKLVDAQGKPFTLEFMLFEPSCQRIINPFARNLERIGITVSIRVVDVSAFENRMRSFDFDVMSRRFAQPLTPGIEQRNYWSSRAADTVGSFNFSGVRDPAVDDLVEHIVSARNRDELRTATRALDRVLMWGWYVIPHWYSGTVKLGYWDRFERPAVKPAYDVGLIDTWWIDPKKDRALNLPRQR